MIAALLVSRTGLKPLTPALLFVLHLFILPGIAFVILSKLNLVESLKHSISRLFIASLVFDMKPVVSVLNAWSWYVFYQNNLILATN
ncbi:hypothetical protein BDV41DRAFT_524485 [Aspergillus transmontanensis]|uniref:Uncharacterized protein n=1 Tax=Aspergillus transmontanensis TaxID=1034304 RepID=A0A5N6WDZ2_9EURO|nr:hypothetical protein BDV41DRAFT_524485 [Aspergillus transmontanensis]